MGIRKHIPGAVGSGAVILYLKETIPKYLLRDVPKNPTGNIDYIGAALWATTNVLTLGPLLYAGLKILTYDKSDR